MNARYDLVEILKKDDYKECTSSSDSKSNERNANRFGKLKRLPKLESRRTKKHVVDLRAMLPDLTFKHVRRSLFYFCTTSTFLKPNLTCFQSINRPITMTRQVTRRNLSENLQPYNPLGTDLISLLFRDDCSNNKHP